MKVFTLVVMFFGILQLPRASAVVTEAEVIVVKGTVTTVAPSANQPISVARGQGISVGSRIDTGDKSDLLMSPFPSSAVRVLENNSVVLTETDLEKSGETILGRKAKLQLHKGTVQVALEKLPGSTVDFKVTTPQCVAAARGTVFSTTTFKDYTTTIVAEGIVGMPWVDKDGKIHDVEVKAGMKLTLQETPDGLVQIGPEKASDAEIKALIDFVKESMALGLLSLPPIGELTAGNPPVARVVTAAAAIKPADVPALPKQAIVTPF